MESDKFDIESDKSQKRQFYLIISLSFIVYLSNIATKNLYSAEIVEIIKHFSGATKATASLATTYYFIPYAILQLFLTKFIKKINLLNVFFITSFVSVFLSAVIPFCTNLTQIYLLFALNGFLQAFTWPAIIYISTNYLPDRYSSTVSLLLGIAYTFGFILDYVVASLFIKFFNWKVGFWLFCSIYIIALLFYQFVVSKSDLIVNNKKKMVLKITHQSVGKVKDNLLLFNIVICIGCFISGLIYYGVLAWTTTLFNDIYNISSSNSALISTLIPVFALFGPIIGVSLSEKMRYWNVLIIFMIFMSVFAIILSITFDNRLFVTLSVVILFMIFARSVMIVFGTVTLMKSKGYIDSGSAAALTNTFSAVGAALGPIMLSFFIEKSGYGLAYLVVAVISVSVLAMLLLCYKPLKHFSN